MKKYLRMLKIKKEEMPLVGILLVIFTALHVLVVRRFWEAFSPLGKDYWWLYVGKFDISGFDPITYSVLSQWDARYQVYRHPLLAFFAWIPSQLNQWLMGTLGMNPVQIIVAVILLACLVYGAVFLFRIFREHIGLGKFDSTLLALLTFSFAYILLSYICPDHFAVSMTVLIITLYAAGKKMKEGTRFKIWQTVILFLVTAGITLSNGIKTFIAALFTNKRHFFHPVYLLLAVILPSVAIWFFARWEYQFYVFPREQQRKQIKAQRAANADRKAYRRFCDTIAIADSAKRRAMFDSIQAVKAKKRKAEEAKKPVFAHQGKPIAKGEFTSWTDITTSRWDTMIENLLGESIQLHKQHLLEDTLRKRPVIVRYDHIYNYVVEALLVLLFVIGIWCGRRSRFLWLCLAFILPDIAIHLVLGFGINEVYIMSAHWLFVLPIALSFAFRELKGKWVVTLRAVTALLMLYLFIYNLWLTTNFLIN
ncbi:MAG: GtrA family protein [Prevotella sp.]|nr:GtrA family protein [Prevotella sp.]